MTGSSTTPLASHFVENIKIVQTPSRQNYVGRVSNAKTLNHQLLRAIFGFTSVAKQLDVVDEPEAPNINVMDDVGLS